MPEPVDHAAAKLAEQRQQIAHEGTGYVPPWAGLSPAEQEQSVREASHWLKAAERAGFLTIPDSAGSETTARANITAIVTWSQLVAGMLVGLTGESDPVPPYHVLERTADLIMRNAGHFTTRLLNAIDEDTPPVSSGGDTDTTAGGGEQ